MNGSLKAKAGYMISFNHVTGFLITLNIYLMKNLGD